MKTTKLFAAAATFAAAVSFSAAASATVFYKDYHDAGVWQAFDDQNEVYSMKYRSDQGKDGFWLVVSSGDNPKGDGESYAILYGDRDANRITAYTYTGENNSNSSYETGTLLGSYEGVFADGGTHPTYGYDMSMFSLDVAGINSAFGGAWEGVQLGENAGIWFHQSAGSDFTYGADGSITDYTFASQMWLDRGSMASNTIASPDCATVTPTPGTDLRSCAPVAFAPAGGGSVPAPGGLALLLVGLAGLGRLSRRNKA